MKKLLAMLVAGIMIFSLAACGGNGETENDVSNDTENNAIESMTLVYGTDEKEITIYKPKGTTFSTPDQDGTELISIEQDDFEWTMDIWGDIAYLHETGQPFVYYYYHGELDEFLAEDYTSFEQTVTDLGFEFNGQPVKRIESTYVEAGEDEEETDIFIGFEFKDTRNGEYFGDGLLGFQLSMYDEVPSDKEYAELFKQVFGLDR